MHLGKARRGLGAAVIAVSLLVAGWVDALADTLRRPVGYDTHRLGRNNNDSTGAVDIGFEIDFYGTRTRQVYVNNNGNVTLDGPWSEYRPSALATTSHVVIAPFLADVDTRPGPSGQVSYGTATVDGHQAFIATWENVGYHWFHWDPLNTFQVVIIDRSDRAPGDFDIEFNYGTIRWEAGDSHGGQNGLGGETAYAGYNAGDGNPAHRFIIPGSGEPGTFLDDNMLTGLIHSSNVGIPGRWLFRVHNGQVIIVPALTDEQLERSIESIVTGATGAQDHGWAVLDGGMGIARNYRCNGNDGHGGGRLCMHARFLGIAPAKEGAGRQSGLAGMMGLTWGVSNGLRVGAGLAVGRPWNTRLVYGGSAKGYDWGAYAFLRQSTGEGLPTFTLAGYMGHAKVRMRRGYPIGSEIRMVRGKTSGRVVGFLARAEWPVALPASSGVQLEPFAEVGVSHVRLKGYGESGADLSARIGRLKDSSVRLRLGSAFRARLGAGELWMSAAWVHDFDARAATVYATLENAGRSLSIRGRKLRKDWMEVGLGGSVPLSAGVNLQLAASTSMFGKYSPQLSGSVGFSVAFPAQ